MDSAQLLLEILNEILDFSRIEAGRVELESTHFNLYKTVEQVIKTLGLRAGEKRLNLTFQIADNVPDRVVGDPLRLQQVLMNLVNNAIKFTVKGQIELCVNAMNVAETVNNRASDTAIMNSRSDAVAAPTLTSIMVSFAVSDTGIGIASENLKRIFSPFTQADASTTRQFGGTGLGLAISNRLVEFMGGRLHVESDVGKGSTFSFEIPLRIDPSETAPSPASGHTNTVSQTIADKPLRQLRILLAEDTRANQKLVTHLLGKRGHLVDLAENGRQALELIVATNYDVVLMDVQMPELDGLQATAEIRRMPDAHKACVPIIALTALCDER